MAQEGKSDDDNRRRRRALWKIHKAEQENKKLLSITMRLNMRACREQEWIGLVEKLLENHSKTKTQGYFACKHV
jgi:hypothetical protein